MLKPVALSEFLLGAMDFEHCATPREVIQRLQAEGLLDERAVERCVVRSEVEQLYAQGVGRCGAIAAVAEKFRCSYGKIRGIIYQKN